MTDSDLVQARLASLFAAVDAQVPAPEVSLSDWDGRRASQAPRMRSRRRIAVGAGLGVGAVIAAGAGAAASGAWPFTTSQVLGNAAAVLSAADPSALPGAKVVLVEPGPETSTVMVINDEGPNDAYHVSDCYRLSVSLPAEAAAQAPAVVHNGSCTSVGSAGAALTPSQRLQAQVAGQTVGSWMAPSGTEYKIVFGEANADTAQVALTNSSGQAGPEVPVQNRWFAVYEPIANFATYDHITFISDTGRSSTLPG